MIELVRRPSLSAYTLMKQQKLSFSREEGNELTPFTDKEFPPEASSIDGRRKTSSSATTYATPVCHCKQPARLKQVYKHGANQGRYFHSCGSVQNFARGKKEYRENDSQQKQQCNFFSWADNTCHDKSTLGIQWQRFKKSEGYRIISSNAKFHASHVQQGGVGDCWFLSAVAVLAERNDLIENVVRSRDLADDKGIEFNLFIDGKWTTVFVDNYLPLRNKSTGGTNSNNRGSTSPSKARSDELTFAYSRPKNDNLWVCFLEKAYAKAHGSYRAISGGWISEALLNLTGCPCEEINFSDDNFDSEKTWYRLISFKEQSFPLGCSTSSSGEGIVGHHAYSILDCRELEGAYVLGHQTSIDGFITSSLSGKSSISVSSSLGSKDLTEVIDLDVDDSGATSVFEYIQSRSSSSSSLAEQVGVKRSREDEEQKRLLNDLLTDSGTLRVLRIRNPWGKTEFTGHFGANSELWTGKLMKILDKGQRNDGTFWITYHDFLRRFSSIDVCKAHRGDHWASQCVQDFTQPKELGCQSSFQMTVVDNTWLYISLIQKNKRGKFITAEDKKYYYSAISFVVVKEKQCENCVDLDMYDNGINYQAMAEIDGAFFGNATPYSKPLEMQLTPGNYRIVPMHLSNFRQQTSVEPQPYFVHIYSSKPVVLNKIDCRTGVSANLGPAEKLRANTAHYVISCVLKQSLLHIMSGGILLQNPLLTMKRKPMLISKSSLTSSLPTSMSASSGLSSDNDVVDLTIVDIINDISGIEEQVIDFSHDLSLPSLSSFRPPLKQSLMILEGEDVLFLVVVYADDRSNSTASESPNPSMQFSLILSTCNYSVDTPYISDKTMTPHARSKFVQREHYKLTINMVPNSFCCVATAVCCGTGAYKEFRVIDAALQPYSRSRETGRNGNSIDGIRSAKNHLFAVHAFDEIEF